MTDNTFLMIDRAGAFKVEVSYLVLSLLLFLWLAVDTRKHGEIRFWGLSVIAGFSIFWQEFYADWGSYLLWSDAFSMMPWAGTLWTTPDKPWFLLASYPVFMCASITLMLWLCRKVISWLPNANQSLLCLFTAGFTLIVINTLLELASVSAAGQWTYVDVIGPAIETAHGLQPLLYPNIPFGVWGGVICALILFQNGAGRPRFECITKANQASGVRQQSLRILAWVIVWNITYWMFLCTPLIAMRVLWGAPNALVP